MKKVIIKIVRGSEGYSLQVVDRDGSGFNGELFLNKLLDEYKMQINCKK